jgi:hypothetical protein
MFNVSSKSHKAQESGVRESAICSGESPRISSSFLGASFLFIFSFYPDN